MKNFTLRLMSLWVLLFVALGTMSAQKLNESFDETGFPPEDWSTIHVSGSIQWARSTSYRHSGAGSVYSHYNTGGGHENYLITPQLAPEAGDSLVFYVAAQNYSGTTMTIEVSSTTAAAASFNTVLATYTTGSGGTIGTTSTSTWVRKAIALDEYVGQRIYLAFHVVDANGADVYVDDVTGVSLVPVTCPRPTDLAVANMGVNSANISWTAGASETQWQWVVVAKDSTPDWTAANLVSSNAAAVASLTENTAYDFYVRAYCSETDQSREAKFSFKTLCDVQAVPYAEDFEAGGFDCWTPGNAQSINASYIPSVVTSYPLSGTHSMRLNAYKTSSTNADSAYVVLPSLNWGAAGIQGYRIQFWARTSSTTGSYSHYNTHILVGITNNLVEPLKDFTLMQDVVVSGTTYEQYEVSLASYNGVGGHIVLLAAVDQTATQSSKYASYYIDDVLVSELPNCLKPTNLQLTTLSTNSAGISWTAGGSEEMWQYLCVPAGETPDWDNFQLAQEGPAITIDDLTPNTDYTFYLKADCGGELSEPASLAFYTGYCTPAPTSVDAQGIIGVALGGVAQDSAVHKTAAPYYADNSKLSFNVPASTTANVDITFSTGYTYGTVIWVDWNNNLTFEANEVVFAGESGEAKPTTFNCSFIVPLEQPLGTYRMRIGAADSYFNSYISNPTTNVANPCNGGTYCVYEDYSITVTAAPNCLQPSALEVDNILSDGATLSWTANGNETSWQYLCVPAGTEPDWTNALVANADSVVISGLNANTAYSFYVRANCSESEKSDAIMVGFLTACGVESIPYAEDFEDLGFLCWTPGNVQDTLSSSSYRPTVATNTSYSRYSHTGSNALRLYAYSDYGTKADSAYVILPDLNFGEEGLSRHTLAFWARSSYSTTTYYQHILVGVVENGDISTFTLVRDVKDTTVYKQYEIPLAAYTGNGQQIALLAVVDPANTTSTYLYGQHYIDDLQVYKTPSCQPLASVSVSDITRTSFVVNFNAKEGDAPSTIHLVCSPTELDAAALAAATPQVVTDTNRVALNDLVRETTYYIYARVSCGADGNSDWVSTTAATKGLVDEATIMVAEGMSTSQYVPVYGLNADAIQHSQSIYPAALLTELQGKTISKLVYSLSTASSKTSWRTGEGSFTIGLAITEQADLSTAFASDDLSNVYTGSLDASGTEMTITLNTPFVYTGGNLLIDFNLPAASTWESAYFYGISQTSASRYAYSTSSSTNADFLPQVGFVYSYQLDACPVVENIQPVLLGDGTSMALIRWDASDADYLSGYDAILSTTQITEFADSLITHANLQADSLLLTGLTPNTQYYLYLRANCKAGGHDEGSSNWTEAPFATLANCPAVANLHAELVAADEALITWETALADQTLSFSFVYSMSPLTDAELASATKVPVGGTTQVLYGDLLPETMYYFYVASVCGDDYSPWTCDSLLSPVSCPAVVGLEASRIEHNRVELTWSSDIYGTESQWEAGIVGQESKAVIVSEPKALLIGLDENTTYTAYVKALCDENDESVATTVQFTTSVFNACAIVGEGTTAQNQLPLAGYYHNSYVQQLFTADELGQAGNIEAIAFQYSAAVTTTRNLTFFLANTDATSLSSSFVTEGLVQVVAAKNITFDNESEWFSIALDSAFYYTGGNLVLAAYMNYTADETQYNGTSRFLATSTTGKARYQTNDTEAADQIVLSDGVPASGSAYSSYNRANVRFCFEASACPSVTRLAVKDITTNGATLTWEPNGSESAWKVFLSPVELTDMTDLMLDSVSDISYAATGLLANQTYWFYVQPACGGNWSSISFTTIATCFPPVNLEVVADVHSALITWDNAEGQDAPNFVVAYGLEETFDISDTLTYTTVEVSMLTMAALNNLEANTIYKFAVKSVCSADDESSWSSYGLFTTDCDVVTLPYAYDFETENDFRCWTMLDQTANTGLFTSSIAAYEGNNSFRFAYSSTPPQYLFSPELVASTHPVKVNFYYKAHSNSYPETFQVGYSMTELSADSVTWLQDTITCTSTTYQPFDTILPAGLKYVAIRYLSNDQYYLYFDNFSFEEITDGSGLNEVNARKSEDEAIKFFRDGHFYILYHGIIFDATGRKVE